MPSVAVVWFRRDLRVHDHPALVAALATADAVVPLFVFDDGLLAGRRPAPNRVWFMRESVAELSRSLANRGVGLRVLRGRPEDVVTALAREVGATSVHLTRDASPYGRSRDARVAAALARHGVTVHAATGLYVHEPDQVLTRDGRPFMAFGPFRRAWESGSRRTTLAAPDHIPSSTPGGARPDPVPDVPSPTADPVLIAAPGEGAARRRLDRWLDGRVDRYADTRNRLDLDGTSRLSQDLRWGLLSPVEVVDRAEGESAGRQAFVRQIAWREFYAHVLWHRPGLVREPYRRDLSGLTAREDPVALEAWRTGRTGYPIVDAAIRQLHATGFMHNRARMIAASFLARDLLLDYRLGEAEFLRHLVDGDLASNNGGWQWTASTGTDPQPWFRVFNPSLQGRRFDPAGDYVRRWVPELRAVPGPAIHEPWRLDPAQQAAAGCRVGVDYPAPVVDHAAARERALMAFRTARRIDGAG